MGSKRQKQCRQQNHRPPSDAALYIKEKRNSKTQIRSTYSANQSVPSFLNPGGILSKSISPNDDEAVTDPGLLDGRGPGGGAVTLGLARFGCGTDPGAPFGGIPDVDASGPRVGVTCWFCNTCARKEKKNRT